VVAKRTPAQAVEANTPREPTPDEAAAAVRQMLKGRHRAADLQKAAQTLAEQLQNAEFALEATLKMQEHYKTARVNVVERERGLGAREGTACLLLSDLHPEEVVLADTLDGVNEFNPEIARQRIVKLIEGVRWYLATVRERGNDAGYKVRDFMLLILGDLISNNIHPDLQENVALLPIPALLFVLELIQMVIDSLLDDPLIETLHIPCVAGNHDRMTEKIRHQSFAGTSLATLLYHFLAMLYAGNPRVKFQIARSGMQTVNIYHEKIRQFHGHQFKYKDGVGGITIPLNKRIARWNKTLRAALHVYGHYHYYYDQADAVGNGSLIGYTVASQDWGFSAEPAQQAMFLIDPKRGKRLATPIQVQDWPTWG
jgi:hypothetical protein